MCLYVDKSYHCAADDHVVVITFIYQTRKPSWRKGYARQQYVYEGRYGRNLSTAGNPTLEPNITSIGKPVAKLWPFFIQDGRQPPSSILSQSHHK